MKLAPPADEEEKQFAEDAVQYSMRYLGGISAGGSCIETALAVAAMNLLREYSFFGPCFRVEHWVDRPLSAHQGQDLNGAIVALYKLLRTNRFVDKDELGTCEQLVAPHRLSSGGCADIPV